MVFIPPTVGHVHFQTLINDSHQSLPDTLSCFDMTEIRCYYWCYMLAAKGKTASVANHDFPIWVHSPPAQANTSTSYPRVRYQSLPAISSPNLTKYLATFLNPTGNTPVSESKTSCQHFELCLTHPQSLKLPIAARTKPKIKCYNDIF